MGYLALSNQALSIFLMITCLVVMFTHITREKLTSSAAIVTVWFVTITGRIFAWMFTISNRCHDATKPMTAPGCSLSRRREILPKEESERTLVPQTGSSFRYYLTGFSARKHGGCWRQTHLPFRKEKFLCARFKTSFSK